jgi:hypothetical protein
VIRNAFVVAILTGVGLVTFTRDAYAYLDPGTASIILQGIIGGIAATLAVGAVYWQRVKYFVARMVGRGGDKELTAAKMEDE